MPTQQHLNGLSGNLQSSQSWSRQQALELMRNTLARTLDSLTPAQQRDYVRLQTEALKALSAVEAQNTAIINTFKTQGLAQLRSKIGGQDPEQIFLHTRYLEALQPPLPWEPRTSVSSTSSQRRFRRAFDEWKYRSHLSTLSLWDAACLNFDFATAQPQRSGHCFIDASYLSGSDVGTLTVARFVEITRELDLGGQLHTTLEKALGQNGNLQALLETSARACLRFDALDAYRNRASSGVTQPLYEALTQAIDGSGPALAFDTLGMSGAITILPGVPFVPSGTTTPLPLLLIKVASLGVLSYFPFRPEGSLRYHADASSAQAYFLQQLKDSHRSADLGWFARQLPLTEMHSFKRLLSDEPRPFGLSPAAGFLYDSFHKMFPERTLDTLHFAPDPKHGPEYTLVQALTYRQVQRYQANLASLASRRSERDLQAVIDGAAAVADEVLQLLLTPMPGGVSGLNRIMQGVVFANLSYSVIVGINEAAKGEASDFAAALADVADLAVNGLLISTAGRVHRQRIDRLLQQLGNPHKVTHSDGTAQLWKPDIGPYAILDQNLLNGQMANAQGIYQLNAKQYVWFKHDERRRVVEVSHDPQAMRFVLKHENGTGFAPPIVFNPAQQAWTLDLQNAHSLSDVQLTERMLPNGSSAVPRIEMERMLRSTSTTRATLDRVWAGQPAPVNLTEGVRRLQVDQLIEQLIKHFHRRGHMPPHADGAVLCLLTQLPTWPSDAAIHVHDAQGQLIETYAGLDTASPSHAINLKLRDDGTYSALDAPASQVPSQEQLFELIIDQQPATSTLGKEGSVNLTQAQRIARLRLQIGALAQTRRGALFSAMTQYAGYARHQVPASDAARALVPVKVAASQVTLTPLLEKLHQSHSPLTLENLARLLDQTPLSPIQQANFLKDGSLPVAVLQNLEHHRTALRIDAVIDGLYHPRAFNPDTDQWAREFASSLVRNTLKRHFVITEMGQGAPTDRYRSSGPDDTTVELLHYGEGRYEAYDLHNAGPIPVSPQVDSFYLAIGSVLQPHERLALGMQSASDAQGLRNTLGDLMSAQRSPEGYVSLLDQSLGQYEQSLVLPADLQPNAEGMYQWQDQQLLPLYGSLYPITFDNSVRKWRLKHPQKVGVDTPRLEHNRHGAWRLAGENPMTWDDHRLFYRLGPDNYHVDQQTSSRILDITDTPLRALREVHSAGLPPPPLLEDTSKRFRLEREISHFIQAMSTYSANHNARPSLQLLLVCALPGWPDSHILEIIDAQQRVIRQYPAGRSVASEKIRITQAQSRGSEPLNNVALNDTLIHALLGELPSSQQERLFKLAKKIAEHAMRERRQLFDILYAQSETDASPLQRQFKSHFPDLPASAIKAILRQSSPTELKQLHAQNQVGLRLAEQARLTANDVRLNRAYEGLYLSTLSNPDSEKITLHLLKSLPGWPADLRLDIHQGSPKGPLLESAGHLAGSERKVLAKVEGGYQAYDNLGQLIEDGTEPVVDLLSALTRTLSASQRKALGVVDASDLAPVRTAIGELALNLRIPIKALLDLPHLPHWLQPPMRVDSSFIAYPFSLHGLWPFSANQPVDLVSKTLELYPSFNISDARDLIDSLGMSEPGALIELQRRKAEYQALDFGLNRWAETEHANDANDPLGMNLGRRRYLAQQVRRAWRRETRTPYVDGLFDTHQLVLQLDGNDLPDADFILGTRGFEHIESLKISGESFPPTGNAFLSKFSSLKNLKIDCMLDTLPSAITDMTQLEQLDLAGNRLVLSIESRQRLNTLTRLEMLNLDANPLGMPPDVSGMTRLRDLSLRHTGINQWPIGAEQRVNLRSLLLQENRISSVPTVLFSNEQMQSSNRNTILHDNPLSAETRRSLTDYRNRTGVIMGGALPGALHVQATASDASQWLTGIPDAEQSQRKTLWAQLQRNEDASPDDAFRVLRDLTRSHAYTKSQDSRQALTARVWRLLDAMAASTELRNKVFLNTYVAGTCGDGALLAFIDMEIEHLRYQAQAKPSSQLANRELLALAQSLFYLRELDRLAEDHLESLYEAGVEPDDAEVKLYYRISLAREFNLPIQPEEMLYSVADWVSVRDIARARQQLQELSTTEAPQNSLLMEDFWVEYLAHNYPEPFSTIDDVIRYKLNDLNQKVEDKRSETYLEQRQSIVELEIAERNRLIRQLTQAAQNAAQRAAQATPH